MKMTEQIPEFQVETLNKLIKIRIAPSPIHGVGIFAIQNIPKNSHLYTDNMPDVYNLKYDHFDKLYPKVREILLERWPQIVNGSQFICPDARMLAYMNHSDEPNYDGMYDMTLRDILDGEEIVEDYRAIPGYAQVFPWLDKVKE